INNSQALQDFHLFFEGDLAWSKINPAYIANSKVNASLSVPFSDTPIIFYTIHQVILWMESVIAGGEIQTPFEFPKYDEIIETNNRTAIAESEIEVETILSAIHKNASNEDNIASLLIDELELCRHQFNELKGVELEYYIAIRRGDINPQFKINVLFYDLESHIESLQIAIKAEHKMTAILCEYFDLTGLHYIDYPNRLNGFDTSEIMMLSNTMVLDNDLHQKMSDITNDFFMKSMSGAIPIYMAIQDIQEKMHDLFQECMDRFLEHLENCEPGNKILLIHSRLKDLKQRELKLKTNLIGENNKELENGYSNLFKEYLQLEADFIRETNNIEFIPNHALTKPKTVAIDNSTVTFGCKLEDRQILISLINTLTNKIDFLNSDLTSAEQLADVFMAKDLSQELPPIYFGCETTQLRYILDKFIPFFTRLAYKNIEDSKLFYTKKGTLIKGQNLYASKIDAPKDYLEIDKAFTLIL
ncbi:MAG: hypothetical protein KJ941_02615, partial [Bacteroidetes bacterium]|nr:hypothetical protein [Bacteroidota bacterium]